MLNTYIKFYAMVLCHIAYSIVVDTAAHVVIDQIVARSLVEARLLQLTVVNVGLALPTSVAINTRAVEAVEVLSVIIRESVNIIAMLTGGKLIMFSVGKECSQLLSQLFFGTPTRQTRNHVVGNAHCMPRIFCPKSMFGAAFYLLQL